MLIRTLIIDEPILIEDPGGSILSTLRAVTRGWGIGIANEDPGRAAVAVHRRERGWTVTEDGHDPLFERTAVATVCSLVLVLLNRMIDQRQDGLFLHAAAVSLGGRTVVFPATHRAGKSTLAAALAFAGHELVSDDILPLVGDAAVAAGVAPRMRLPLPPSLRGAGKRCGAVSDARTGYLLLPEDRWAAFGCRRSIDVVVIPDRRPGTPARLHPVDAGEALRALLVQSHGQLLPPQLLLDTAAAIVSAVPAYRLAYDDLSEVVALLEGGLPSGGCEGVEPAPLDPRGARAAVARDGGASRDRVDDGLLIRRRPGVDVVERHGVHFLLDPENGRLFEVAPVGRAIWELLGRPMTAGEVAGLVCEAFPATDRRTVSSDARAFLGRLRRGGLLAP